MRFHTQTAGVSLTAQQPLNNIVRTAIEALAGVLGGTQSLHTNSYDEALALPTEDAVRIALRTQQIIAHETGVTNTIDPLGGWYFVEALTDRLEELRLRLLPPHRRARRDGGGGQARLPAARDRRRRVPPADGDRGEASAIVVGVNDYLEGDGREPEILRIDAALERKQIGRDPGGAGAARRRGGGGGARAAAHGGGRRGRTSCRCCSTARAAHATEGEIVMALQDVWGSYTETPVF